MMDSSGTCKHKKEIMDIGELLMNGLSGLIADQKGPGAAKKGPSKSFYDETFGLKDINRRPSEAQDFLLSLVEKQRQKSDQKLQILDTACGSGTDGFMFAKHGYKVVSMDISQAMVDLATKVKEEGITAGIPLQSWDICIGSWDTMVEVLRSAGKPTQFDCVTCIGCSWPFIHCEEEIRKAFTGLCEATKPGGLIILDHRNFLPVLKRGSFNKNGSNPFLKPGDAQGITDAVPFTLLGPEGIPLVTMATFLSDDKDPVVIVYKMWMPDKIKELAQQHLGDRVKIDVYYDMIEEAQYPNHIDACWVTYAIHKPEA